MQRSCISLLLPASGQQSEVDELDGMHSVAAAQGVTRIPDPGHQNG